MNPDSTISAIRPSMMALVSTTIRGSPSLPGRVLAAAAARGPIASAAAIRSLRLATVRPIMPRPRKSETPSGSQVPERAPIGASGRPSRRPMQQAENRPTTAVTNSAVDSSWTCRTSQPAGTTVRYGSMAKPTIIHATTQAARRRPRTRRR